MKKRSTPSRPRKAAQRRVAVARLRELNRLVSVGDATLRDFDRLGIQSVEELAGCDAKDLYERLCRSRGSRLDPCCEDIFQAAIAQAKNPNVPAEQKNWWYWSRRRKARQSKVTT